LPATATASATTATATRFRELNGDTIIIKGANIRIGTIPPKGELTTKVIISPKFELMEDITGKIVRRTEAGGIPGSIATNAETANAAAAG
jgi:hypothetical protein